MKLSKDAQIFLVQLRAEPKFRGLIRELSAMRPVVPSYRPQESTEATHQLLERIKYESALRDGFDLAFSHLTGDLKHG